MAPTVEEFCGLISSPTAVAPLRSSSLERWRCELGLERRRRDVLGLERRLRGALGLERRLRDALCLNWYTFEPNVYLPTQSLITLPGLVRRDHVADM